MKESLRTRQTLIARVQNGQDSHSWEEFVASYRRYLYVVVRNMNLRHEDTEDVVQATLLTVWEKLPDFEYRPGESKFRTWLCAVARNKVMAFIRSHRRSMERTEKWCQEEESYLDKIALPEIEKIAEQEWRNYIANLAWENISSQFSDTARQAFLALSEGKRPEDIAASLGIAQGSVYVYKQRIQHSLYREINRLDRDLG